MTPRVSMRVGLLGPLEVTVAGQEMAVGGPGRRALLAALALNVGTPVGVPQLVEAIWDDRPPATATTKLQGHVSALRQGLLRLGGADAAHLLQTRPPGYVLCAHRTSTDLIRFDDLLRQARCERLPERASRRAETLSAALRLWRGDACTDIRSGWVASMAASLDERRMRAMEDLAEARLILGEHDVVIDAMEPMVRRVPYRERAWEHLMAAHLGRGDTASALAAYDDLCRILTTDLGVGPGRRISRLVGIARGSRAVADR
ncbi:BTAD domain-containing putative transcriptional regulator [Solwaraspora sp. WMMD1047]|uniref:AfsR/SARP family transcriptional regulator n=1 Tax=Solwaraspora sp. WMMD1047 TaxID=3016102 RepID=UPI002416F48E|nr:BTAD domain-containing putative transcriptional regulator [Solwaraspora sp. WMMD1047]MDG4828970.1 BTAD domain-containing putative transcriptional regulator [Solwaraspora sp. WMMD1047]